MSDRPENPEQDVEAHAAEVFARIKAQRRGVRTWRRPAVEQPEEPTPPQHLRGCPPEPDEL